MDYDALVFAMENGIYDELDDCMVDDYASMFGMSIVNINDNDDYDYAV